MAGLDGFTGGLVCENRIVDHLGVFFEEMHLGL